MTVSADPPSCIINISAKPVEYLWVTTDEGDLLCFTGRILGDGSQQGYVGEYAPLGEHSFRSYAIKSLGDTDEARETAKRVYQALSGLPGCVPFHSFCGEFVAEPVYGASLDNDLRGRALTSVPARIDVLRQLVIGVNSIHITEWHQTRVVDNRELSYSGYLYHGDLKPQNIFTRWHEGQPVAHIGDYGFTGHWHRPIGTAFYMAPELAETRISRIPRDLWPHWNQLSGGTADMWSLGLTLAAILKNKITDSANEQLGVAPLDILKPMLEMKYYPALSYLRDLRQPSIDSEILAINCAIHTSDLDKVEKTALIAAWAVVNRLLQVNPLNRMNVQQLLLCTSDHQSLV
jgi:serine/threonine protein kinase